MMNLFVTVTVVQRRRTVCARVFFTGCTTDRSPFDSQTTSSGKFRRNCDGFSFTYQGSRLGYAWNHRHDGFYMIWRLRAKRSIGNGDSMIDPTGPKINQMMIVRDEQRIV